MGPDKDVLSQAVLAPNIINKLHRQ